MSQSKAFTGFTRRNLLAMSVAPLLAPTFAKAGIASLQADEVHRFQHDHILGTSLDLMVTGVSEATAEAAEHAALSTVERLRQILSTYDPASEISRLGVTGAAQRSSELDHVLAAYRSWNTRTHGSLQAEINGKINVDALGKAFIIDQATAAAHAAAPNATSLMLDIGGDIKMVGNSAFALGIADPASPWDNGTPLTHIHLADQAVATSGTYARGPHIIDPRNGHPAAGAFAVTVVAADCMTANALATALCVLPPEQGLQLVENTHGAEAILIDRNGAQHRTSGFAALESPAPRIAPVYWSGWPNGFQVSIQLTLKTPAAPTGGGPGGGGGRGPGGFGGRGGGFGDRNRRPYVAVWAEDANGKVVRNIAVWASKPRYLEELRTWWQHNSGSNALYQMARATRAPGEYNVLWNGMTDAGQAAPTGTYKLWVETAREHGGHYQESAMIDCSDKPSSVTLRESPEFDAVKVDFGPAGAVA
ncbi:MAG: DUF2271 domain-containing protein [Acidobacteriota bacterium]